MIPTARGQDRPTRTRRPNAWIAGLCAAMWMGSGLAQEPPPAPGDEIVPSLNVALSFADAQGAELARIEQGQTVRLRLGLRDAVTGRPATARRVEAWVRAADPANPSCEAAVRAFRATRALPVSAMDLNGILLVTLNRDNSIGVIDPRLNLASSNMIAAHRLGTAPGGVAADAVMMRLLATQPETGELRALSLISGAAETLLTGLSQPGAIALIPSGGFWIGEQRGDGTTLISRHDPAGQRLQTITIPQGGGPAVLRAVPRLAPGGEPERNASRLGAFTRSGALLIVEAESGSPVMQLQPERPIADAAFLPDGAVLTLDAAAPVARLRFADDPAREHALPLDFVATRLAAHPAGRFAIAYAPGSANMVLIDSAGARLSTIRPPRSGTISEVLITRNAAVTISHDGGIIQVIDLARVASEPDYEPAIVTLGGPGTAQGGEGPLLVSLSPSPQVLAVDPDRQTGWIIHEETATTERPPMDSTRLRGGVPEAVHVVDRSLRSLGPGRYEVTAAFDAGAYELVVTSGQSGLSRCLPFAVEGDIRRRAAVPVTAVIAGAGATLQAGVPQELRLELHDAEGRDRAPAHLQILIPSMLSSWRQQVEAHRAEDGALRLVVTFPHAGPYAIQPLRLPDDLALRSTPVLEVSR